MVIIIVNNIKAFSHIFLPEVGLTTINAFFGVAYAKV